MSIDYKNFGEQVKAFRKELNLTQLDVTKEIGVSQETLRRIENGLKPPTLQTLEKLSVIYKRDLLFILTNTRTKTDLFSEDIIKHANKLLQSNDFTTFKESVVEFIEDVLENFDDELFENNKQNFINYLYSVKDFEFVDVKDKKNNIINLKSLLFELSRSRSGIVEDPYYYPLEISVLLTLAVILRRNDEIEESIDILDQLFEKLSHIETPTKREVEFYGSVCLNLANAYFRLDRYQDVVDIITRTLNDPRYSYSHILYCELNFRLATALLRLNDPSAMALFTTVLKTTSDERRPRYCKTLTDYYKIDHELCNCP